MVLQRPIGIFDAGIGSYAIVERVRARFPRQDILYLADRASFPYGSKAPAALLESVTNATRYLAAQGCSAVVLASNAPSIVVLGALQAVASVPVIGVFPPVEAALLRSRSKQVAVLGVQSMVSSAALQTYVAAQNTVGGQVQLVNASSLVDLVETFAFLDDAARTQQQVGDFMAGLLAASPKLDVITLSSSHLPWLRPFFERAAPKVAFLDPADLVLDALLPYVSAGSGLTRCVATDRAGLPLAQFNQALRTLGTELRAEPLAI